MGCRNQFEVLGWGRYGMSQNEAEGIRKDLLQVEAVYGVGSVSTGTRNIGVGYLSSALGLHEEITLPLLKRPSLPLASSVTFETSSLIAQNGWALSCKGLGD